MSRLTSVWQADSIVQLRQSMKAQQLFNRTDICILSENSSENFMFAYSISEVSEQDVERDKQSVDGQQRTLPGWMVISPPQKHYALCSTEPCGGPGRGLCRHLTPLAEDLDLFELGAPFLLDDRLNWPTRFVGAACTCQGNFGGYACHLCKAGWRGTNCTERRPLRVRRNVLSLTKEEQRRFRDRIALSKKTPMTEWLVLNITDMTNGDPVDTGKLKLIRPPSVYDFYVFVHLYASRSTLVMRGEEDSTCDPADHMLDFAHKGPAFLTWHRAYLMEWEDSMARLGGGGTEGDDFTFPYWDWTGDAGCPVCTNDLVGAPDANRPGRLDNGSAFADWITFCPRRPGSNDCHTCDPGSYGSEDAQSDETGSPLWRRMTDPQAGSGFSRLPDQTDMDVTLDCVNYDVWPYRMKAGRKSFRDLLEGFTDPKAVDQGEESYKTNDTYDGKRNSSASGAKLKDIMNIPVYMHNLVNLPGRLVHSYFNGSWFDVSTSPNDPIFLLHHAFVDKVFELWFRKNRPEPGQYPKRNCPPGHNAYSAVVPFFPPVENIDFFVDSRRLGYDYDDYKAGTTVILPAADMSSNLASALGDMSLNMSPPVISSIVLGIVLFICLIAVIILAVVLVRHRRAHYTAIDSSDQTERPYLAAMNTWRKVRFGQHSHRKSSDEQSRSLLPRD
ncbi:unnamed protein product [Calicophoron daubneyi]|uniref:Tyrosinase copper-binding domain-containing protein n=1 Tax=Calicophoron daubneyi TaxID=300641 RepID=A0AAV2T9N0_CALDB